MGKRIQHNAQQHYGCLIVSSISFSNQALFCSSILWKSTKIYLKTFKTYIVLLIIIPYKRRRKNGENKYAYDTGRNESVPSYIVFNKSLLDEYTCKMILLLLQHSVAARACLSYFAIDILESIVLLVAYSRKLFFFLYIYYRLYVVSWIAWYWHTATNKLMTNLVMDQFKLNLHRHTSMVNQLFWGFINLKLIEAIWRFNSLEKKIGEGYAMPRYKKWLSLSKVASWT